MGSLLLINELTEKLQELSSKQTESDASAEKMAQTAGQIEKISERISGVAETIENA